MHNVYGCLYRKKLEIKLQFFFQKLIQANSRELKLEDGQKSNFLNVFQRKDYKHWSVSERYGEVISYSGDLITKAFFITI
ncbi:hypothetical protein BpHYR1_036772 [Brachionus plicatilis]|uniref:Uncharacterized protein n=1 Tax=Brachionus plicatilis TaxID=10195 RepID=A0A3M7SZW9_BRAPC|nr:hypothetical protein BpHYR1_036772 [Brachionus plicatilis]